METIRNKATVKVECPRELLERFAEALAATEGVFEQREAAALALGNELVRQWIERQLGALAKRFDDEVNVDGVRYHRHAEGTRQYHTLQAWRSTDLGTRGPIDTTTTPDG